MKKSKTFFLLIQLLLIVVIATGCWNYREINRLSIVAGLAIDKGKNNKYLFSVEIVNVKTGGVEPNISSEIISVEGESWFDAARNAIKVSGKRLYFSHTKIVIISKEIAEDGLIQILDWLNRDAETRLTIKVMVSKEKTAEEVLSSTGTTSEIHSFELDNMLTAQPSVPKFPNVMLSELINNLAGKGISTTLPAIKIATYAGKRKAELGGTAVFKRDKLVGFLNEEETQEMLFVKNKIKSGIIVSKNLLDDKKTSLVFEIFKSKTQIKPEYSNGELLMNIHIATSVSIGEQGTTKNYIDEKGRKIAKTVTEKNMEKEIQKLIKRVQEDYNADIFGFGKIVMYEKPELWRKMEKNWDEEFKKVGVNIDVELNVKNSGISKKPITVGD